MADSKRFRDWYVNAKTDLESANILFRYHGDPATVAFHCQQAVEKALKGFILSHTKRLYDGHSLVFLCKKAAEIDPLFSDCRRDLAYLNQFYIESRYPADMPHEMTREEAKHCLDISMRVFERMEL